MKEKKGREKRPAGLFFNKIIYVLNRDYLWRNKKERIDV